MLRPLGPDVAGLARGAKERKAAAAASGADPDPLIPSEPSGTAKRTRRMADATDTIAQEPAAV